MSIYPFSAQVSTPFVRMNSSVLVAVICFCSMILVRAESKKLVLAPDASTNSPASVVLTPAVTSPATTNSPSISPFPPIPSITVTHGDDDNSDDDGGSTTKVRHHGEIITINRSGSHGDTEMESTLIPLAGILGAFGTPILIVFFVGFFRNRRRNANLAMAREYLNKGMPVPPQLLDESQRALVDNTAPGYRDFLDRRRGIRLLFIGVAISLAFYFSDPHSRDWAWGLILIVIGLGYLFSSWLDTKMSQPKNPGASTLPPVPPS